MVAIKWKRTTLDALNEKSEIQQTRPYLGISMLGHECSRYLWYTFRWCYQDIIEARMRRLFNRGHREEKQVIKLLNYVGVEVHSQQTEVVFVHGHVKGHCDGVALGVIEAPKTDHLLEIKTMNDSNFKKLCKQGLQASKPQYYIQANCYATAMKLKRILFWATNKNDDHIYIERLETDKSFAADQLRKAESIILSENPPNRLSDNPNFFQCKWCSAYNICHKDGQVQKSCRSCKYGDLIINGWECGLHGGKLKVDTQRIGCNSYLIMPILRS